MDDTSHDRVHYESRLRSRLAHILTLSALMLTASSIAYLFGGDSTPKIQPFFDHPIVMIGSGILVMLLGVLLLRTTRPTSDQPANRI